MKLCILITHECSGEVRRAFRQRGISAYSCDLKPAEDGATAGICHYQQDAISAILSGSPYGGPWNAIGLHPPCTYITGAGIHWNNRGRGWERTEEAIKHVEGCVAACGDTPYYLENPVGILSTRWRKPDQIIQPYEFGDDASKKTCLWLQGLPRLRKDPAQYVPPRWVCKVCGIVRTDEFQRAFRDTKGEMRCCIDNGRMLPRWANQTDSGQNRLGPSETRAADRARTYPGIAAAMAAQWSARLLSP